MNAPDEIYAPEDAVERAIVAATIPEEALVIRRSPSASLEVCTARGPLTVGEQVEYAQQGWAVREMVDRARLAELEAERDELRLRVDTGGGAAADDPFVRLARWLDDDPPTGRVWRCLNYLDHDADDGWFAELVDFRERDGRRLGPVEGGLQPTAGAAIAAALDAMQAAVTAQLDRRRADDAQAAHVAAPTEGRPEPECDGRCSRRTGTASWS